ncbi:DNA replication complex GINS protein PSF2 isoform X2 [Sorex araneus]|uniref:DNA replication complex GINS protein PSF2 isoform X2 n=1 Tax=Sorex araneus TaxID=42254 RepID=UPI00243409CA|nr:DNA replication complex GINS protein PSF2 isoform X2 [Sorex araneus]
MDVAEVEFLAEKELVTIIPNFSLDKIYLIGGELGPFLPGLPLQVPLWLAMNLKQRQKCRLVPPEWMDVGRDRAGQRVGNATSPGRVSTSEKLEKVRDQERQEETFTPVPSPHYMELTRLLLSQADEIRTLVKDVWDTRTAKLRVSADSFVRRQEAHAKLDNLTLLEISCSGPFLTSALGRLCKLRAGPHAPLGSQSQDW